MPYELVIRFADGGTEQQLDVLRDWCDRRRVDGVVLLDLTASDPRPALLADLSMPFAMLGGDDGAPGCVRVTSDEEADAACALEHLVACGYDGVLQLTGPIARRHEQRRLIIVQRLCARLGLPHGYAETDGTIDGGLKGFGQLEHDLSQRPGVIAASDLLAIGALRGATLARIDVPGSMGVVSWDDSLLAEVSAPSLTALARHPFEMGQMAGSLLIGLLHGEVQPGAVDRPAPSPLVPRASTSAL
jgi:DNA-binding LacI/PurR family transcriptional regulator